MNSENFTTKFFTETISLQGFGEGGIDANLFESAFFEMASRNLPAFAEDGRHERSLRVVSLLVNTPRRYHRFKYALRRRLPDLLDEVDDYDLLVIAALEACDAAILRILINNGNDIFINNQVNDRLKAKIDQLNDNEKEAYKILIQTDNNNSLDKYLRASAKEHWRAAFLGLGPFTSIMKWVDILSKQDDSSILLTVRDLLAEVTSENDKNYEIITDTLRDLFQKKYDVENNVTIICKILQELGLTKVGPLVTPTLVRIIQKELSVKDTEIRFNLLKVYLSVDGVDYSLPGRLFFYLVENPERGKVVSNLSDGQVKDLAKLFVNVFLKNQNTLTFSENCLSYLFRVKWASQYLNTEDPIIPAVISKLINPELLDGFVYSLLSSRHPWQPIFSDHHVDTIHKLIGINNFYHAISSSDCSKLNSITTKALDDFKEKYASSSGDITALISMFD